MQTIKEQLIREIELYDISIDGFSYLYEVNKFKEKIDEMHGSIAQGSLISTYYAYSVGQKKLLFPFLPQMIGLCQTSIELKVESDWIPQDVSQIYETYSGCVWLYTGEDDISIWKECLTYHNLWVFKDKKPSDFSASKGMTKDLFYTYLQRCLFAKEYKLGIDVYEYFEGKKEVKLTSKTGILTLMYAILCHYEYSEFDKARLNKVCRQVLAKELKYVYSMGRPDDAVYWLKTMCALRDKEYTPEEVVLTFYEFLEDDEIPDEIKILLKETGLFTRTDLINQKLI